VEEATAELRARKDEAERATLAKSRFLAAASHDLRQPMHALGLFISELSQHAHQPETRRLVRQIAASAEAMENLLDSLLDISKLDAGVFKPNLRTFPLQPLLDRLAVDFLPMAEERRLRLRLRPTGAWVESDPALLERVLINLLSNALRYTQEGSVLVACRRRGPLLRLEVRDSGVGIAPEAQDIIFHEFVQLENAERARNKGLGLGLAIVRRLTDLLGHRLALRSRVGGGSVFAVELPYAEPQEAAPAAEGERPPGDLAGTRIVVVDDDPLALASLHSLLLSWGCQVYAADGLENIAMELATRGVVPQVVVSDYRLRGPRTGVDVIRALRNRWDPELPAILISGDTAAETLLEFVRGMWSNMGFSLPGMVTPTLDVDELDRRIKDMKAVEGWLKMNLNMLQMSIQGLEMQRAALAAVRAMSEQARGHQAEEKAEEETTTTNPFAAAAAMWPWNMMGSQQAATPAPPAEAPEEAPKPSRGRASPASAKKG
jgi:CheY-like chemotaxis protein/two-component sensor histidine kinase